MEERGGLAGVSKTEEKRSPWVIVWDTHSLPLSKNILPWQVYSVLRRETFGNLIKCYFVVREIDVAVQNAWIDFQAEVQFIKGSVVEMFASLTKHIIHSKAFQLMVFSGDKELHPVWTASESPVTWVFPRQMEPLPPWFPSVFQMKNFESFFEGSVVPEVVTERRLEGKPFVKEEARKPVTEKKNAEWTMVRNAFLEYFLECGVQVLPYTYLLDLVAEKESNAEEVVLKAIDEKWVEMVDEDVFKFLDDSAYQGDCENPKFLELYQVYQNAEKTSMTYAVLWAKLTEITKNEGATRDVIYQAREDGVLKIEPAESDDASEDICTLVDDWFLSKAPKQPVLDEKEKEEVKEIFLQCFEAAAGGDRIVPLSKFKLALNSFKSQLADYSLTMDQFFSLCEKLQWIAKEGDTIRNLLLVVDDSRQDSQFLKGRTVSTDQSSSVDSFYYKAYSAFYNYFQSQGCESIQQKVLLKGIRTVQGVILKTGFTNIGGFLSHLKNNGLITMKHDGAISLTQKFHDYFEKQSIPNEAPKPPLAPLKPKTSMSNSTININPIPPKQEPDYALLLEKNPEFTHLFKIFQSAFKNKNMKRVPLSVISTIYDRHIKNTLNSLPMDEYINKAASLGIVKLDKDCAEVSNIMAMMKVNLDPSNKENNAKSTPSISAPSAKLENSASLLSPPPPAPIPHVSPVARVPSPPKNTLGNGYYNLLDEPNIFTNQNDPKPIQPILEQKQEEDLIISETPDFISVSPAISVVPDEIKPLLMIFHQFHLSSGKPFLRYSQLKNLYLAFGTEQKLKSLIDKAVALDVIQFHEHDMTLHLNVNTDLSSLVEE